MFCGAVPVKVSDGGSSSMGETFTVTGRTFAPSETFRAQLVLGPEYRPSKTVKVVPEAGVTEANGHPLPPNELAKAWSYGELLNPISETVKVPLVFPGLRSIVAGRPAPAPGDIDDLLRRAGEIRRNLTCGAARACS